MRATMTSHHQGRPEYTMECSGLLKTRGIQTKPQICHPPSNLSCLVSGHGVIFENLLRSLQGNRWPYFDLPNLMSISHQRVTKTMREKTYVHKAYRNPAKQNIARPMSLANCTNMDRKDLRAHQRVAFYMVSPVTNRTYRTIRLFDSVTNANLS
jgi:hypothetical protein